VQMQACVVCEMQTAVETAPTQTMSASAD